MFRAENIHHAFGYYEGIFNMRRFILKVLLFIIVFFLVDFGISSLLHLFRPEDYKAHIESKFEFFDRRSQTDILILGDSHVADALNPQVFETIIHQTAFNFGIYHSSPFENYHLSRYLLKGNRKEPGVIILGTNPFMFCRPLEAGDYTPILIKNPYRKFRLYYESSDNTLTYFSSVAKEKYLFKSMFRRLTGKELEMVREIVFIKNGYLGNINHRSNEMQFPDSFTEQSENPEQVRYFIKTIEYLKSLNKKVIIVNPPIYNKYFNDYKKTRVFTEFSNQIRQISESCQIPVFNLNYEVLSDTLVAEDFLNAEHLNNMGANKFTAELCKYLEKYN
jgi:hypothetical protein